jgi:hypothetical protein
MILIVSSFKHRERERERVTENLELPTLSFGFGALCEIGDHAEPAAGILDDGDGQSPSPNGFIGRPLGLHVEVFSQIPLHLLFNANTYSLLPISLN